MKRARDYAVGAAVGFINGFFASGGGIVAVLALKRFLKVEEKKAHATAIAVILPLTIAGMLVYSRAGFADFKMILKNAAGGVLGAGVGAKLLTRLPVKYIRAGFGVVMIAAAVRMFFR